jgi:hypothetical protein
MGFSGRLNTAFIERAPLTVRHGVSALARRTWAKAQPAPHLLAHLEWWRAYYHGCRVLTQRYELRSYSPASEVANWRRNAIGNVPLPWQREERSDDGRRAKCSLAHCRRFPLERHQGRMWVQCHLTGRLVKVLAEELAWSLAPGREGPSGLPHHKNPARSEFGKGCSIYPPCPMAVPGEFPRIVIEQTSGEVLMSL